MKANAGAFIPRLKTRVFPRLFHKFDATSFTRRLNSRVEGALRVFFCFFENLYDTYLWLLLAAFSVYKPRLA